MKVITKDERIEELVDTVAGLMTMVEGLHKAADNLTESVAYWMDRAEKAERRAMTLSKRFDKEVGAVK